MIPTAPCKVRGVDCQSRHLGCQSKCEKYQAFRADLDRINAERKKDYVGADYAAHMIWRDRHKLKYTSAGKRALAQR